MLAQDNFYSPYCSLKHDTNDEHHLNVLVYALRTFRSRPNNMIIITKIIDFIYLSYSNTVVLTVCYMSVQSSSLLTYRRVSMLATFF